MSSKKKQQHIMPTIPEWYQGRSILVTGATGFLGKVLLEKLLRSIPDISNIYILVRPKHGLSPSLRVDEITKLPLFQQLRESNPEVLKKIVAIEGNVTMDDLGINERNMELLHSEVSVVIHVAATVKLGAPLKEAVKHNLCGTDNVLKFCKGMKQLKVIVHSSTAYCHCEQPVVEEKIYPPTQNPKDIMNRVNWMDEKTLDQITPSLIYPHPNTYTFTKRLAESVVEDYGKELPVVIVRPSIILPALKEPMPGWVDTLTGVVGMIAVGGKGILRSMMVDREKHAEVIPVDSVSNAMIIAAWYRATRSFSDVPVYNLSQCNRCPVTWNDILDNVRKEVLENPFDWPLWYPDSKMRTNQRANDLSVLLFQLAPAYLVDFILMFLSRKTFLVRTQKRIIQAMKVQQYFTLREWNIKNGRFLAATNELCQRDKEVFYTDSVPCITNGYIKDIVLGIRQYCLKENPENLPRARRYIKFLYFLDRSFKCLFVSASFWLLLKLSMYTKVTIRAGFSGKFSDFNAMSRICNSSGKL